MRMILSTLITLLLLTQATFALEEKEYPIDKLREQNQKIIKMVVEEISKNLPQEVDKYTKMTKIRDENLTLIYTFEINTGAKSDEAVIKEDKPRMEKAITKGVCQSSKRFLEAGVTLTYEYISASSKKELFSFTMTDSKCKKLKYD
ncbi:hypothetical protein MNB_SV-12-1348 [hydrothermal vent metagenome]|uniref:Uncharacterized protein n=1 Tax=hydrothermal vent metagenome TaxID=652676 RepID=A0A1W1BH35_9ZZZZ